MTSEPFVQPTVFKAKWGGPLGEQENQLYLNPRLLKRLRLPVGETIVFKTGNVRYALTVGQVYCSQDTNEPIVFVSPDIFRRFPVPPERSITLRYDSNSGTMSAGPIIGLFTVRNILSEHGFGSQDPILTAMVNSAPKLDGFIYVFCPEDIDWAGMTVTGHIPAPCADSRDSMWRPLRLPLPDVVYDRIPSRSIESKPEVQQVKERLMRTEGLHYFNPRFLNKWETHLALKAVPEVAEYLPPTAIVESPESLEKFIRFHGSVFLKPCSGSLGRRIIRVSADKTGVFHCTYRRDKQTMERDMSGANELLTVLRPMMGSRSYIVQKDLNLAKYNNCPFDVRILAQKDLWGRWRRTKLYARVAAPDSFLSNLSDGGKPAPIKTVLQEVFNCNYQAGEGLGEALRQAAAKIPSALEQSTGKVWAELGIDLGIDKKGKVWLIEINSKPFRTLVSDSGSVKLIERSLMRPLEYARYLAGFYRHSPFCSPPIPIS